MRIAFALLLFLFATNSRAEEWGVAIGFGQTDVQHSNTGEYNVRGGLMSSFFFSEALKLRTGILYSERHFEYSAPTGRMYLYHYDYLDLPALLQYEVKPGYAFFVGPVFAFNVLHDISGSPILPGSNTAAVLPLLQLGLNFIFDDMWGFDMYYEQGLQPIDGNATQLTSFGLNLVYYFL